MAFLCVIFAFIVLTFRLIKIHRAPNFQCRLLSRFGCVTIVLKQYRNKNNNYYYKFIKFGIGARCYHKFWEIGIGKHHGRTGLFISVSKFKMNVSCLIDLHAQHVVVHDLDFNQQFLKYHTNTFLPNRNLSPNSFYAKIRPAFYVIVQHISFRHSNRMAWQFFAYCCELNKWPNKTKTNHLNKSIFQFCAQDTSPGISMRFVFVYARYESLGRQRKMSVFFFGEKFARKSMMTWNEISRWEISSLFLCVQTKIFFGINETLWLFFVQINFT